MSPDLADILLGGLFGAIGGLVSYLLRVVTTRRRRARLALPAKSYTDRLSELLNSLHGATQKVDSIFEEIAQNTRDRQKALETLESTLADLTSREELARKRIAALQRVPVEAVAHFQAFLSSESRRSARRDYGLFLLGVVVSTVIAVLLNLLDL